MTSVRPFRVSRSIPFLLPALLCPTVASLVLTGCADDNYAERVELSHIDREVAPGGPFESRVFTEAYVMDTTGAVTVGQTLDAFVGQLQGRLSASDKVGTFPLVSYGLRREGAWVSELGLRMADDVANRLRASGFGGRALSTPELDVALNRKGQKKSTYAALPNAVDDAAALDLTVVVFGTIKRENNQPVNGRDLLTFDVTAMRIANGEQLARAQFQMQSDRKENTATFDLAARDSLWLVETK